MNDNASLGPDAHPTKSDRPTRGRDGRKAAQSDTTETTTKEPPNRPTGPTLKQTIIAAQDHLPTTATDNELVTVAYRAWNENRPVDAVWQEVQR